MAFVRKIKVKGQIYLAEVITTRFQGKVKQKLIRWIGRSPKDSENILKVNNATVTLESSRIYGSVLALDFIAKKIGLYEILGPHAPAILTLVYCHCHNYKSVRQVRKWFNKTDLRKIFNVPEITENMLHKAILSLEQLDLQTIQKKLFENLMNFCEEELSSVLYDVTNTYFTGKSARIAKKGKDKEGVRGRRLIQIGLVVTKKYGLPIFHQVHSGNIHDAKIFYEAQTILKLMSINSGTIIYDRGMTAKDSILDLVNEKWTIIAGMPMNKGIKKAVEKIDLVALQKSENQVQQGDTFFYVTSKKYTFGKVKGRLVIMLNFFKKQREKVLRDMDLQAAQASERPKVIKLLKKNGAKNATKVANAEHLDGLSFLFTTGKIAKTEALRLYFEKDLIEKSFRTLKGVLSLRPIRMWIDENVRFHVFICYIGYTLLACIRCKLSKNGAKYGLSHLSVEEALEDLAEVSRVYFQTKDEKLGENREFFKLIALSKHHENILKAISPDLLV